MKSDATLNDQLEYPSTTFKNSSASAVDKTV
mgnify:FL=1